MVSTFVKRLQDWVSARGEDDVQHTDKRSLSPIRRLGFEEIEPRILYSADPLSASLSVLQPEGLAEVRVIAQADQVVASELVVIDSRVEGADALVQAISQKDPGRYHILLVDEAADGVAAVSAQMQSGQRWEAIHLITHGAQGQVQLGNSLIDADLLNQRRDEFSEWAAHLTESGDFLLYGCDVGAGSPGAAFVEQLSRQLQADVAASNNATGRLELGGDWELEVTSGLVEHASLATPDIQSTVTGLLALTPVGTETLANTSTSGNQTMLYGRRTVGVDAAGNYVVIWADGSGLDGSGLGIYARQYDASGTPLGGQFRVNTTTANDQNSAQIGMSSNGSFVVVWESLQQDGQGSGVYAQRYNASGVAQGAEFRINTTTVSEQGIPAVALDSAGNFVVTWESFNQDQAGTYGVYARRYNAAGTALSGEVLVNTNTSANQSFSAIGMDAAGNYTIAWHTDLQDGDSLGVYAQRYNSSGVAQGSEFLVNTTTIGSQAIPAVAMDGTTIVIAWEASTQDAGTWGVYARRYTAAGVALGSEFQLNSISAGTQENISVAMTSGGGFLASWNQDLAPTGVYVRQYDAAGVALSVEQLVDTTATGSQYNPTVAANTSGNVVISWSGEGVGDTVGMFFQRLSYAANSAPVLNAAASPVLGNISEDAGAPVGAVGTLVSALVDFSSPSGQVDNVTDANGGALLGIAVTGLNSINGTWWYSTDSGSSWSSFGIVSDASARLLAADTNTRVYFQANSNFNGVLNNALCFRAWDRTSGINGGVASLANVALDNFATVAYNNSVGSMSWNGSWTEADMAAGGAAAGNIKVTASALSIETANVGDSLYRAVNLTGTTGASLSLNYLNIATGADQVLLQVSSDGGSSYTTLDTFSGSQNLGNGTLAYDISAYATANTRIRFYVGNRDADTFFVFDDVKVSWNQTVGGNTAFSLAMDGATQTVLPVNDAPVISFGEGNKTFIENQSPLVIDSLVTVSDVDFTTFAGSHLLVDMPVNGQGNEFIRIRNQGMTAGLVGVSANNVYFGGILIATFSGSGAPTDVLFNASATQAGVEAVMRNIVFDSPSNDTVTLTRTARFRFVDSAGLTSASASKQITIQTDNDIWVTTNLDIRDGDTSSIFNLMANRGADGAISLAEAIAAANNTANSGEPDKIYFDIAQALVGGAHSISLTAALPSILDAVVIDATSDGHFSGTPVVEVNGSALAAGISGFDFVGGSAGSTIRGLTINGFSGYAIVLASAGNTVQANYLGTNILGDLARANGTGGIYVSAANNTIGGSTSADRNLISGNLGDGVALDGVGAHHNVILNNLIGSNALQSGLIANADNGIGIYSGAANNVIGSVGAGNTLVGNFGGIVINGVGSSNNRVVANYIGTTAALVSGMGNLQEGVEMDAGANNNLIGGVLAGEGNVIAFNGSALYAGISVNASTGNSFLGNSIHSNANLGIVLDWVSALPTPNDVGDIDSGANDLQNYPVLWDGVITAGNLTVRGNLNSTALTTYRIELFSSALGTEDSSGYGEGVTLIAAFDVTTDAGGNVNFSQLIAAYSGVAGSRISATATVNLGGGSFGSTSEFAMNIVATNNNAGIVTSISSAVTTEVADSGGFWVSLNSAPASAVTLTFSVSDSSEARLPTSVFVFSAANWNVPQFVNVIGVDDFTVDGDVAYTVNLVSATSADPLYNGMSMTALAMSNTDNDIAGVLVSPPLVGGETLINETRTGLQRAGNGGPKVVAMDPQGNYAVVWTDIGAPDSLDGSRDAVLMRLFRADGAAMSGEILVNETTFGMQTQAAIVRLSNGDLVVTWDGEGSGDVDGIFMRRFDATGNALSGELPVNSTVSGIQTVSSIAGDASGNFVVVWTGPDATGRGIFGQRFSANGSRLGAEFQVNAVTSNDEFYCEVAMNAAGQFVVVWRGGDADGTALYARVFDPNGVAVGGDIKVNSLNGYVEDPYPSVGMSDDGRFVIAWSSSGEQDGSRTSALARQFDATGNPLGAEFFVGSRTEGSQFYTTVGMLANGEFVLSWNDFEARDGNSFGVYAQRYRADGSTLGSEFRVNTTTSGPAYQDQYWSFLGTNRDGRMVVVWNGVGVGDSDGVFAQSYDFMAGTTEGGGTVSYSVVLDAQPTADVTFSVAVSNGAEANVSVTTVTFTSANWNIPQLITLTGLQDFISDGDTSYTLILSPLSSADAAFNGLDPQDVAVVNHPVSNLPPVISYGAGAVSTNEDVSVSFSSLGGNPISLSDVDAGSNFLQLSLSTVNGILNLSSLAGLSVVGGANGSASMVLRGSLADLNAALDGLTRSSTANWNGSSTIQLDLNDLGNTGTGGAGLASRTITVSVSPVNDAPVLSGSGALNSVLEDAPAGAGTLVSTLIAGLVSDADNPLVNGIALYAVDGSYGTWQYTVDGATWQSIGAVTTNASLLLLADATTAIRFIPDANYFGTAAIAYRAWDQSTGSAGSYADSSNQGGSFAFSSAVGSTTLVVNSVNDAPTGVTQNRTINENTSFTFGLTDFGFSDSNDSIAPNAFAGVKITSLPLAGSLTLSGAAVSLNQFVSAAQLAAGDLVYAPVANDNGVAYASLSFQVTDNGGVANGGADTDAASRLFSFDVTAVNSAPTIVLNTLTVSEGATVLLSNAFIATQDSDNSASQLMITVSGLSHGQFEYVGNAGVAITSFTQADIDAGLVQFVHDDSQIAPAYALSVSDGALVSGPVAATISYTSINDAPTISVASIALAEDGSYVFSLGGGNPLLLSDVDAGAGLLELSLTSSTGVLTLSGTTGLIFQSGANGAGAFVVRGTLANLNAALEGLRLSPTSDFNGIATLTVQINDLGNSGTGGALQASQLIGVTVAAVNDAPVLLAPGTLSSNREDALAPTGTLVASLVDTESSDVDSAAPRGIAIFQVDNSNGQWEYTLDGTTWLSVGVPSAANALLLAADATTAIRFVPTANWYGASVPLDYFIWDQSIGVAGTTADTSVTGGTSPFSASFASALASVTSVNDAPQGANQTISILENGNYQFFPADFGFTDPNDMLAPNSLAGVFITSLPANGSLTLSGIAVIANQFVSAAQLSAGFLVFAPAMDANGVGYASFDFRVRDNGGVSNGGVDTEFGTHTFTVNVTPVNNPPTVSSNSLVISEGAAVVLTSANVNTQDVDNLASELLISVSGLSNGQFEYVANAGVAISSFTQADINAGLVRFVHDGSQNAPAYMLAVSDGVANTGPQSAAIVFNETNDAPLIGYSAGAVLMNEDGLHVFSVANGNAIVLSDVDAGGATVRLALSANNGNLLLASVSGISIVFGADGSASMVLEGTLAAINNALNGLSYTALPNFNGADGISLLLDDLGNSGSGGPLSAVLGIAVTVSPVNDAPMIALPAVQNVGEDVALVLGGSNRLQIADVDAAGAQVELTLSVNFGLISLSSLSGLSFVSGDGLADGSMVVRGTVAELNAALDGLVYTPDANFYGAASLSIAVNDLGNTGGAALGASASLTINVLAQNDAPSQVVPGAQTTLEDTALVFAGANRIQIVDLDAGAAVVRVSLQVGAGSLSLSATAGLSFSQGDGVSDSAMQFSGTLAAINAALNGLVYLPDPNVNGSDQLLITTEDLGNVGSGGSLLRFDQVSIAVLAANDPISVSAPSNLQIPEDTMAFVQSANGQFFTLQDIDSQGFPVQIVVSVDIGLLQLSSLAGITVLQGDPAGSSMLILRGELTSINDALTTLRYSPPADYFGSARISVSADDLGGQPGSGPSALAQANLDVMVTGVNDAPELTLANTLFTVQQLGVGQAVSEGVAILDVDSTALMQAVASVSSGFEVGKDVLYLDSSVLDVATRNAISAVWDGATGQLLLTGSASASQYASALSALRFSTTSTNPSQRAVAFSVGDGQVNSPVSKSIGSMSFAVTVAPVGPVVVTTDPVVAIAPGLQPTPTQIDGAPSGAGTGSNLSTPVISANDASSSVLSQVEAENDLADRQRRSVRLEFDGVNGSAAASVRANKLNFSAAEVASPLLGVDLNLRADATGELRFEERGDEIWKLGTGNRYTGTRTAARFSDLEEQRLVEDIARESKASDTLHLEISAAQATSAGAAAFATLLLWSIRAGGIVAAIATSAPAWRNMDPLPLLLDEKGSGVDEPAWGDTETPTVAAVDGSTMMDAQALLNGA